MTEEERLADALEIWAAWWNSYGRRGYSGPVLPPLRLTEHALPHRRGVLVKRARRRPVSSRARSHSSST